MDTEAVNRLLANYEDEVGRDYIEELPETSVSHPEVGIDLGPLLGAAKRDVYSSNPAISNMFTLRKMNLLYGTSGGCKYDGSELPEFDRCVTKGCISPMRRFHNCIGHFIPPSDKIESYYPLTLSFQPELLDNFLDLGESLSSALDPGIRRGRLWALPGLGLCASNDKGNWRYASKLLDVEISECMTRVSTSLPSPLSVHSQHAWLESDGSKAITSILNIFNRPEETTAVTSLLGTLHNNQTIDMAHKEPNGLPDMELRSVGLDVPGFLCRGYTPHSTEAGRVRKGCSDVEVRVLNRQLLDKTLAALNVANNDVSTDKDWLLFCMGKMCRCSFTSLQTMRRFIKSVSSMDIQVCTLDIRNSSKCAILSISSGVLLRRDARGSVMSSVSLHSDKWPIDRLNYVLPSEDSPESLNFYFSTFFQLIPYIAFDRPPRTVISSVQCQQAIATPYGAGTSSIAPTHTSKPLVSTELLEEIMKNESSGIPDFMPGEEVCIAYINDNDTYEDSIVASEGSVSRGLFEHMAYSAHVLSSSEKVPEPGEYVNIHEHRWWKSYANRPVVIPTDTSSGNIKVPKTKRVIQANGDGRGRVIQKGMSQTGDILVKVLRFSPAVTGNKVATGHGQKGVMKLRKEEDMYWGVDENGEVIKFDLIISVSSVTNRLTNGQYYEIVSGVDALREGRRVVVSPIQHETSDTETVVYDGRSGKMVMRCSEDGDVPVMASWGFARVWGMTQVTWDKQHYTHNVAGRNAITTPVGRSAGGGVKLGEMDMHSIASSGMVNIADELVSRIDCVDTYICGKCQTILQACRCGDERKLIPVSIPHSMLVFNYANILTTGHTLRYTTDM